MSLPINERLRQLRKQQGLTQEQLAQLTHVSRQTISNWETGRAAPDYDMLHALADALGTSASDLLGEAEAAVSETAVSSDSVHPQKKRWLLAGAVCLVLLAGLIFLLWPSASETTRPPIAMEWFQEPISPVEGQPFLHISANRSPVPRTYVGSDEHYCWNYQLRVDETGGAACKVLSIQFHHFFENGGWNVEEVSPQSLEWGNGDIGAGSMRQAECMNSAIVPMYGRGVLIKAVDAAGQEYEFRGFIPYAMDY